MLVDEIFTKTPYCWWVLYPESQRILHELWSMPILKLCLQLLNPSSESFQIQRRGSPWKIQAGHQRSSSTVLPPQSCVPQPPQPNVPLQPQPSVLLPPQPNMPLRPQSSVQILPRPNVPLPPRSRALLPPCPNVPVPTWSNVPVPPQWRAAILRARAVAKYGTNHGLPELARGRGL